MKKPRALVDQVVTADESAEIIGVSVRRVREYLTEGRLPGRLANGTWLVARADAEAFKRGKPGRPAGTRSTTT